MSNTRLELLNEVFTKIGLKRARPASQYLSRRELEYLRGWIEAVGDKVKGNADVNK